MIEESVAFLVSQGKEVVYDAEHFFDAYDAHPDYALDCLRAAEAGGAAWITPCDTNGATLPARASRRSCARCAPRLPGVGARHPHPQRRRVRRGQQPRGRRGGRPPRAGHGQRLRRALRQRQPGLDHPGPRAEDGLRGARARAPVRADLARDLRRRDRQPAARLLGAVRRPQRVRPQGRHAPAGDERRRSAPTSTSTRTPSATSGACWSPSCRGGARSWPRRASWAWTWRTTRSASRRSSRGSRSWSTQGYHFEVADGSFELLLERETGVYEPLFTLESFRVITEKRADGRVETEATIKIFHQGERLVATAEGNGPINALDSALRLALEPRVPELGADRAGQLQGPDTRRDQGDRPR